MLKEYISIKFKFFSKHSYSNTGNLIPVIPIYLIVKRDKRLLPTTMHIKPYSIAIPQYDAIIVYEMLTTLYVVPLLTAKYTGNKFVYEGIPESVDQAVTLLEDIPFDIVEGVINNIYNPVSSTNKTGASIVLTFTATLTTPTLKYPTILLAVLADNKTWAECRRTVSMKALNIKEYNGHMLHVECCFKKIARRVEKAIMKIQGKTIRALKVSDDPPVAVYPLFLL